MSSSCSAGDRGLHPLRLFAHRRVALPAGARGLHPLDARLIAWSSSAHLLIAVLIFLLVLVVFIVLVFVLVAVVLIAVYSSPHRRVALSWSYRRVALPGRSSPWSSSSFSCCSCSSPCCSSCRNRRVALSLRLLIAVLLFLVYRRVALARPRRVALACVLIAVLLILVAHRRVCILVLLILIAVLFILSCSSPWCSSSCWWPGPLH